MTTQPDIKPVPSKIPESRADTPPATDEKSVSLTPSQIRKLIDEDVAKERALHEANFKKAQSDFQRKETQYKKQLEDAQAMAEGLTDEDKALFGNVRELINDAADTVGESMALTQSQIDLLRSSRTMKQLKAMAKEFQAVRIAKSAVEEPRENDSLLKRLEALGANRGPTPGGEGGGGGPEITPDNADKLWLENKISDERYRQFLKKG